MTPVAENLSNADMNDLAAYFSAQTARAAVARDQLRQRGRGAPQLAGSKTIACSAMARRCWACNTFRGSPGSRASI